MMTCHDKMVTTIIEGPQPSQTADGADPMIGGPQCTVVNHSTRKGEINYFVPYEGLNWF